MANIRVGFVGNNPAQAADLPVTGFTVNIAYNGPFARSLMTTLLVGEPKCYL